MSSKGIEYLVTSGVIRGNCHGPGTTTPTKLKHNNNPRPPRWWTETAFSTLLLKMHARIGSEDDPLAPPTLDLLESQREEQADNEVAALRATTEAMATVASDMAVEPVAERVQVELSPRRTLVDTADELKLRKPSGDSTQEDTTVGHDEQVAAAIMADEKPTLPMPEGADPPATPDLNGVSSEPADWFLAAQAALVEKAVASRERLDAASLHGASNERLGLPHRAGSVRSSRDRLSTYTSYNPELSQVSVDRLSAAWDSARVSWDGGFSSRERLNGAGEGVGVAR